MHDGAKSADQVHGVRSTSTPKTLLLCCCHTNGLVLADSGGELPTSIGRSEQST